jgi:hypothetical protein
MRIFDRLLPVVSLYFIGQLASSGTYVEEFAEKQL